MSIENDGTKVPFLQAQDKPKYDFEVLYKDKYFLIVQGEDKDFKDRLSVGIRWSKSRNEVEDKPNLLGFPLTRNTIKCWMIVPDDFAISLLTHAKSKQANPKCEVEVNLIDKAIQILTTQIKEQK